MPNFLVAAIIGIVAFSAAYLILSQGDFLSTTLSTTANAVKIFSANIQNSIQNATQNISQNLPPNIQTTTTTRTTRTTTSQTQQTIQPMQQTIQPTQTTTGTEVTTETETGETETTSETTETVSTSLCKGHALCDYDTVTNVIDGDTLVTQKYGTIRLALINAPEKEKEGYEEAKEFLNETCFGVRALIDQDDGQPLDQFGRKIAVVYCDEFNMNEELVYSGLAEIEKQFCSQSEFANEEWAIDGGCE